MESTDPVLQENKDGFDVRKADAAYRPFPPFRDWSRAIVDNTRWNRYSAALEELKESSNELLESALRVARRAAAVDTGAIEGLYETDRGFTMTVATQAAHWESRFREEKGPTALALFENQLDAYEKVLDFATGQVRIGEAWIRELHSTLCRSQSTYKVWTEIGPQEHPLPVGEYKHLPNHVIKSEGQIHSYAPVDMTPAEMHRFCQELRGEAFAEAHPVLQASYAHYGLAAIHPFADGNGRVARALASVFTYRARSVPLLILVDSRKEYYAALEAADNGNYQPFVDFVLERSLDAIQLVHESFKTAAAQPVQIVVADIEDLYHTSGGFTHNAVDDAGYRLFDIFRKSLEKWKRGGDVALPEYIEMTIDVQKEMQPVTEEAYRLPIARRPQRLELWLASSAPADAGIGRSFTWAVPRDCGREDDLIIVDLGGGESFAARITELTPVATAVVQMRVGIWVERKISELLSELKIKAEESLRRKGY